MFPFKDAEFDLLEVHCTYVCITYVLRLKLLKLLTKFVVSFIMTGFTKHNNLNMYVYIYVYIFISIHTF